MSARGETRRVTLADGRATTVHVVSYPASTTRPSVVQIQPEASLETWAGDLGVSDVLSGGFATKPEYEPLGALQIDGRLLPHRPFAAPWPARRGALAIFNGSLAIGPRDELPDSGDLLQAGPVLVRAGRSAIAGVDDPEGFSTTCEEFDQDITAQREPRLAFARTADAFLAVAADGRSPDDAGLTLWELADLLVELGAEEALNLDGGSAAVLIAEGRRWNTPRTNEGEDMDRSSPSVTAIVFAPR